MARLAAVMVGAERRSVTIVLGGTRRPVAAARVEGDDLWLTPETLHRATGWELTPEGVCLEGLCVPDLPGPASFLLREGEDTWVSPTRVARLLDRPVTSSPDRREWTIG